MKVRGCLSVSRLSAYVGCLIIVCFVRLYGRRIHELERGWLWSQTPNLISSTGADPRFLERG